MKYHQVAQELIDYISTLTEGEKLPNRNRLAQHFGVARTTLEHAIANLISQGYLISRDGSGTYVARRQGLDSEQDLSAHRWLSLQEHMAPLQPKVWALLLSNILYDIYPRILRAVQDVASQHDISLIVCNTDNLVSKQDDILYRLALSGVSGMIVVPAINGVNNPLVMERLQAAGIKLVSCFRPLGLSFMPGAYGNSFQAGYLGTRHLLAQGCKKIAFFSSPMYQGAYERYKGYATALSEAGGQKPLLSCEKSFLYAEDGIAAARELMASEPDIDGIFAFNDRVAREVYQMLSERGLRPGRDVQVIGCDNSGICNQLSPRLSSISFPLREIGTAAAEMLRRISQEGGDGAEMMEIFGCTLIPRASTQGW